MVISAMQRQPPRPWRWLRVLIVLAIIDTMASGLYVAWGQATLPPPVPLARHTAGILFFDDFDDHGGLGEESRRRVAHALRLIRQGRVERLICVGGKRSRRQHTGSELMAAALIAGGVPAARVASDRDSFDTRTNWQSARTMLAELGVRDPLLISSPLHLMRIRRITDGIGTPAPTETIAQTMRRTPVALWLDIHREWVAWTAMVLLPAETHRSWIRQWREFQDNASATPFGTVSITDRALDP